MISFGKIFMIADASIFGRFRSIIMACLPNDMPKEVKLRYMQISGRWGGITRLGHQKDLSFIDKVSPLGHKSASHFETYMLMLPELVCHCQQ